MANRNAGRTSDAHRETGSSSAETSDSPEKKVSSAGKDEAGRQHAARSGTTPLGDEAAQSDKAGPGGVEGTGGPI